MHVCTSKRAHHTQKPRAKIDSKSGAKTQDVQDKLSTTRFDTSERLRKLCFLLQALPGRWQLWQLVATSCATNGQKWSFMVLSKPFHAFELKDTQKWTLNECLEYLRILLLNDVELSRVENSRRSSWQSLYSHCETTLPSTVPKPTGWHAMMYTASTR